MVPAHSDKVPRVSPYSGYRLADFRFTYGAFTSFGRPSQARSVTVVGSILRSEPRNACTPVWALPRSLAATYGITFVFSSSGYLDVSVHRVPPAHLWIQCTVHEVFSCGFPHSDICGSLDICSLPQLFAAYHVLLRLLVPRHPPCALSGFAKSHSYSAPSGTFRNVASLACDAFADFYLVDNIFSDVNIRSSII